MSHQAYKKSVYSLFKTKKQLRVTNLRSVCLDSCQKDWPAKVLARLRCLWDSGKEDRDSGAKLRVGRRLVIQRQPFAYLPRKFHNKCSEKKLFKRYFGKKVCGIQPPSPTSFTVPDSRARFPSPKTKVAAQAHYLMIFKIY